MNQGCQFLDSELQNIYNFLVFSKNKKEFLTNLEIQFPNIIDLREKLLQNPQSFWVSHLTQEALEIRPKVKIDLCFMYNIGNCKQGACGKLHLCKENLLSQEFCNSPCKHGYSHDINDNYNRNIISSHFSHNLTNRGAKLQILRSSFPRICKLFTEEGVCTKEFCGYLHICQDFLNETCISNCKQAKHSGISKSVAHDFSNYHNVRVLNCFGISLAKEDRNQCLANILVSKIPQPNRVLQTTTRKPANPKPYINHNQISQRRSLSRNAVSNQNISSCRDLSLCFYYLSKVCKNTKCPRLHICKDYLVDENLCRNDCKFSHEPLDMHNKSIIDKIQTGLPKKDALKLIQKALPQLCNNYVFNKCQWETKCVGVHICKNILIDLNSICKDPHCVKSHDLLGDHNKRFLKKYPTIENKNQEKRIKDYFITDILFSTKQLQMQLPVNKENEMTSIMSGIKIKSILTSTENDKFKENCTRSMEGTFNSLKEAAICYEFLNDQCRSGELCTLLHPNPKVPYLWYYKCDQDWKSFTNKMNDKIEKCYCNPKIDRFDSSLCTNIEEMVIIDFRARGSEPTLKGSYDNNPMNVRRLSTISSVLVNEDVSFGLTKWKWYWQHNDGWEKYSNWTSSEKIETSYLTDDECYFSTPEFVYSVSFERMEQKNLHPEHLTTRKVRRRPLFIYAKTLSKSKAQDGRTVPFHWPSNVQDGFRLSVQNPSIVSKIKKEFLSELGPNCCIVSIEEVCNETFYSKYQNTKENFCKKLGEDNINDFSLYHGTTRDVVDKICAQNFDWRMCGAHGTSYGRGCYFAKALTYSHKFAKKDENKECWMFIAQVLAGQYTLGNSSMTRPPPIPDYASTSSHTLYDSCVDSVHKPKIFVIFERDQYYPKYLVRYTTDVTHHHFQQQQLQQDDLHMQTQKQQKQNLQHQNMHQQHQYYHTPHQPNSQQQSPIVQQQLQQRQPQPLHHHQQQNHQQQRQQLQYPQQQHPLQPIHYQQLQHQQPIYRHQQHLRQQDVTYAPLIGNITAYGSNAGSSPTQVPAMRASRERIPDIYK